MTKNLPQIELIKSRDPVDFLPLLREIDFGDRFILSMMHWCGIGKRSTPLEFWQVYLVKSKDQIVGVTGLYRQPGMSQKVLWLGWTGLLPSMRRQGLGSATVRAVLREAKAQNCDELWVYTGSADSAAGAFYQNLGFELRGRAAVVAKGLTGEQDDWVLKAILNPADVSSNTSMRGI